MTLIIPKPASFPKPTWVEDQFAFVAPDGTILPTRLLAKILGPRAIVTDDPRTKQTLIDLTRLLGNAQQTVTVGDTSAHIVGTGIDIAADASTTIDAEVVARDASGNRGVWRLTAIYDRTGVAAPTLIGTVSSPTGYPKGTNAGAPPSGWAATIVLGTGPNANTAYVQVTGQAVWYWYLDGSRYPGDELALALTVTGVWPTSGPVGGGTSPPTFISIVPAFGPTGGGP